MVIDASSSSQEASLVVHNYISTQSRLQKMMIDRNFSVTKFGEH